MMEAGVHFGHGTRKWNPKMAPYISAKRKGLASIDLELVKGLRVKLQRVSRDSLRQREIRGHLGRVVNALAKPIDGRGEISASEFRLIESAAPGIISRRSVYDPLQTGLSAIDSMIPRTWSARTNYWGQTETGKTAVATDTILNQGQNVICVYVAIGQKALVAQVVTTLQERGAMEYTIVVAETADSLLHYNTLLLIQEPLWLNILCIVNDTL
ncbi:hypothetical protein HAX54_020966 [Datura stramonium]|uniref:ATPase F1/V1/A1 complex alpha/beta subunit nucleotide-binding domain-containing protein n=1 Tax=Datura stramonium TaxID=4076 RepID=A0ABS8US51_DATST|nr:hypothetical protein [Datura stramonium]